jgi:HD-GYP domain-containing protein (c-di-GMP phosphodiesterase class II)
MKCSSGILIGSNNKNCIMIKKKENNNNEYKIIKSHTFYTYYALNPLEDLSDIAKWAAYHHEHLDGSGYPFGLTKEDLPLGSRIMAVADVFTAVTEDRPYRDGLSKEKTKKILSEKVENDHLDSKIVELVFDNYDLLDTLRQRSQKTMKKQYDKLTNN